MFKTELSSTFTVSRLNDNDVIKTLEKINSDIFVMKILIFKLYFLLFSKYFPER